MLEKNEYFKKLEKQLSIYFIEKAPYPIPENTKVTLAKILPWLILIVSVFSIITLIVLVISIVTSSIFDAFYGIFAPLKYLSNFFLILQIITMGISIPGLFNNKKESWNLLFISLILSIIVGLLSWLSYPLNVIALFSLALRTVVFLYLLFQLKDQYT